MSGSKHVPSILSVKGRGKREKGKKLPLVRLIDRLPPPCLSEQFDTHSTPEAPSPRIILRRAHLVGSYHEHDVSYLTKK